MNSFNNYDNRNFQFKKGSIEIKNCIKVESNFKQISKHNYENMLSSITFLDVLINNLYKKQIYTIHNVYQELYRGGKKPTGFGDFIRGCFFLLQFCKKYKFKLNIIINHPVALYLKHFCIHYKNNKKVLNITKFDEHNFISPKLDEDNYIIGEIINDKVFSMFIYYLSNIHVENHQVFSYNILFPHDKIEENDRLYIQNLLEPNEEMNEYVDETLLGLKFVKKKYAVIHIRCGDEYLSEKSSIFSKNCLIHIFDEIVKIINLNHQSMEYLLISDNNFIKNFIQIFLCNKFTNVKILFNSIIHLGELDMMDIIRVKNTMLDFYLLANSCSIYAISLYSHGSGFSLWCAKTYNISYKCKYINIT